MASSSSDLGFKRCSACTQVKPISEFDRNRSRRDGLANRCKLCRRVEKTAQARAYQKAYYWTNREQLREKTRQWQRDNPDAVWRHKLRLRGLTVERFEEMLAQQESRCAICGADKAQLGADTKRGWHVDHDHSCCPKQRGCRACIRGLLCSRCNHAMGMFGDSAILLRAAAAYLDEAKVRHQLLKAESV